MLCQMVFDQIHDISIFSIKYRKIQSKIESFTVESVLKASNNKTNEHQVIRKYHKP